MFASRLFFSCYYHLLLYFTSRHLALLHFASRQSRYATRCWLAGSSGDRAGRPSRRLPIRLLTCSPSADRCSVSWPVWWSGARISRVFCSFGRVSLSTLGRVLCCLLIFQFAARCIIALVCILSVRAAASGDSPCSPVSIHPEPQRPVCRSVCLSAVLSTIHGPSLPPVSPAVPPPFPRPDTQKLLTNTNLKLKYPH